MTRIVIIAAALLIGACSCSTTPVASAQNEMEKIRAVYRLSQRAQSAYEALPECAAPASISVPCADPKVAFEAQRANYNAAAAVTKADGERSVDAVADAWRKVGEFALIASKLRQ